MEIKLYDIEWEIDEYSLQGIHSHTGERWGHLLADAEDELDELPTEMILEIKDDANLGALHWEIQESCGALYCQCVGYKIEDDEDE